MTEAAIITHTSVTDFLNMKITLFHEEIRVISEVMEAMSKK